MIELFDVLLVSGDEEIFRSFVEIKQETTIHPIGLASLIVLSVLTLWLPRKKAVIPFLLGACFIASGQRLNIAGLDFTILRLLTLVAAIRILWRREYVGFRLQPVDLLFPAWMVVAMTAKAVLTKDVGLVIFVVGVFFDYFGAYALFRVFVRDWDDQRTAFSTIEWIAIPVAAAFAFEWATQYNAFSILGGVPEITIEREGKLRCQGAFSHAILAGVFWAALLPIIASRWWDPEASKIRTLASLASAFWIIFTTSSSTPILAVGVAIFGGGMIVFRHHLKLIRWTILCAAIAFHMLWQHPIWALFAKVNLLAGSTGYHRYALIDAAVNRFGEWALVGTTSTRHWGWGLIDVTNQYILEGINSGALGLLIFVLILTLTFRNIGLIWKANEKSPRRLLAAWALGTSMFVHCVSWTGIAYFGQIYIPLYLVIAMAQSLAGRTPEMAPAHRPVPPMVVRP